MHTFVAGRHEALQAFVAGHREAVQNLIQAEEVSKPSLICYPRAENNYSPTRFSLVELTVSHMLTGGSISVFKDGVIPPLADLHSKVHDESLKSFSDKECEYLNVVPRVLLRMEGRQKKIVAYSCSGTDLEAKRTMAYVVVNADLEYHPKCKARRTVLSVDDYLVFFWEGSTKRKFLFCPRLTVHNSDVKAGVLRKIFSPRTASK